MQEHVIREEGDKENPRNEPPTILDVKMKKGEKVMQNILIDLTDIANTESIGQNENTTTLT
jgi:hypothetical protein